MPEDIRYCAYPSAKVLDKEGNQIQHLLWGDWVQVKGAKEADKLPVHVRGTDGFMSDSDLQTERLLEIVFVDVGQGDGCLVVTPEDELLIVDAGEAKNMYHFLNWRFRFRGGVRAFDAAIITHPDVDHYKGFAPLFENTNIKFKRIYHNGIMEQTGKPFGPEITTGDVKYISGLIESKNDLEAFLADKTRYGQKVYANMFRTAINSLTNDGDIRMVSASGDPAHPNYLEGFGPDRELRVKILGPIPEHDAAGHKQLRWFSDKPVGGSKDVGKTKNGNSVVLMLEYRGISILLGGDLNSSAESFLLQHYTGIPWPEPDTDLETEMISKAQRYFAADVCKCCHHGSADFTDAFMRSIYPAATVVSSGDEESHAHPRSDTLGAIGLHGRGWRPLIFSTELARSTREYEDISRIEIGKLLEKIDKETDVGRRQELIKQRDELLDKLTERNVTTYGAINLRTNGLKAVFAYKLEIPREGKSGTKKTINKWDIYRMEKTGSGELAYIPGSD